MDVKIKNDTLIFQINDDARELKLNDIALIGEYTTEAGPFAEDHYIIFFGKNGDIFEISLDQYFEIKEFLIKKLNANLELKLILNTSFKSRVVYPDEMKEKIIWIPQRNNGLLNKMKSFFMFSEETNLNKELIDFIDAKSK